VHAGRTLCHPDFSTPRQTVRGDKLRSRRATIRCCHPLVPRRMLLAHPERVPLQILKTRRRRLAELLFSSWTRSHSVLSHSGNGGDREPGEIRAADRRIVSTEG
jgi:hypothetical protein